jgi:hypothetical protein
MKIKLVFDKSAKDFVLDSFHKKVDDDGYIVEKSNPLQKVMTIDGQDILADQFAGIRKGSEIYVRSDIISLIEMCDDMHKKKAKNSAEELV